MPLRICFLGSGSKGNCTLVEYGECRFLIDAGLGIRRTTAALGSRGVDLDDPDLVLLTHAHRDHVKDPVLKGMARRGAQLFCRAEHRGSLESLGGFRRLDQENLVHFYTNDPMEMLPGVTIRPIPLPHDADATHGFAIDFRLGGSELRFGYVADCGTVTDALLAAVRDVEVLALEFNHDEAMERESGRPAFLIERVLGPLGHLSNAAAADLVAAGGPKSLIQIHLSEECNHPDLARDAARSVMGTRPIHQASQATCGPVIGFD